MCSNRPRSLTVAARRHGAPFPIPRPPQLCPRRLQPPAVNRPGGSGMDEINHRQSRSRSLDIPRSAIATTPACELAPSSISTAIVDFGSFRGRNRGDQNPNAVAGQMPPFHRRQSLCRRNRRPNKTTRSISRRPANPAWKNNSSRKLPIAPAPARATFARIPDRGSDRRLLTWQVHPLRRRLIAASYRRWAVLADVPTSLAISSYVNRPHRCAMTISRSSTRQFGQRLGRSASGFMLISPTLEPPLRRSRFVTLATSIAAHPTNGPTSHRGKQPGKRIFRHRADAGQLDQRLLHDIVGVQAPLRAYNFSAAPWRSTSSASNWLSSSGIPTPR